MHEFSLCEGIVEGAQAELARIEGKSARLLATRIVVGALHSVVPDTLRFAYDVLVRETRLEGSRLEIREEPVTCECRDCSWNGCISPPFFVCGKCGSANLEVKTGKELYIESLEVDLDE
jgi:hydrogenase nickel incorporation protein HypA/HybF